MVERPSLRRICRNACRSGTSNSEEIGCGNWGDAQLFLSRPRRGLPENGHEDVSVLADEAEISKGNARNPTMRRARFVG